MTAIILLVFAMHVFAKELTAHNTSIMQESLHKLLWAKLFERVLKTSPLDHVVLDNAMLGKPSHLASLRTGTLGLGLSNVGVALHLPKDSRPLPIALFQGGAPRPWPVTGTSFQRRGQGVWSAIAARRDPFRVMADTEVVENPAEECENALIEGKAFYKDESRGLALNTFERAVNKYVRDSEKMFLVPKEMRQELLYSCLVCTAASGDIEQSKIYLREMTQSGISWDEVRSNPNPKWLKMEITAFVRNQLKGFAAGKQKSVGTIQREATVKMRERENKPAVETNLEGLKDFDYTDAEGNTMDVSIGGILRRVSILLVAVVVGYIALFNFGLQFVDNLY